MKTVKDVQRAVDNIQSLIYKLNTSITVADRYLNVKGTGSLPYFLGSDYRYDELSKEFVTNLVTLISNYRDKEQGRLDKLNTFMSNLDSLVVGVDI